MQKGRRRILLVAAVAKLNESHWSLSKAFKILNLPWKEYAFLFIGDFMLLNLVFGLSTSSATYPCIYCERSRLPTQSTLIEQFTAGDPRTVRSIQKHAAAYKRKGNCRACVLLCGFCVVLDRLYVN